MDLGNERVKNKVIKVAQRQMLLPVALEFS